MPGGDKNIRRCTSNPTFPVESHTSLSSLHSAQVSREEDPSNSKPLIESQALNSQAHFSSSSPSVDGLDGGEGGIRTHGTVTGTRDFQSRRFVHSRTSPDGINLDLLDFPRNVPHLGERCPSYHGGGGATSKFGLFDVSRDAVITGVFEMPEVDETTCSSWQINVHGIAT